MQPKPVISIEPIAHLNHKESFGISSSIDLYECNDFVCDPKKIEQYVIELCDLIKMKRFGECKIVHFGQDPKVMGYSMAQLIETSLISGHFVDANHNAYIDIFSCKEYDINLVAKFTSDYFESTYCFVKSQIRK